MTKKQKIMLVRILIAALLLVGLNFVPAEGWLRFVLYLIPYLVIGYDILLKAFKGIRNGQVFDECFLMAVATIGAIALALYERSGDYTEACGWKEPAQYQRADGYPSGLRQYGKRRKTGKSRSV